jgi:hypothetical protein
MKKPYSSSRKCRCNRRANQTDPLTWTVASHMTLRAQPARRKAFALALLPFSVSLATVVPVPIFAGEFVSRPYLAVASAPALRFEERTPPPDLSVRPPAGAPPQPAGAPGKTEPAGPTPPAPLAQPAVSTPSLSPTESAAQPEIPPPSKDSGAAVAPSQPAKPPASILPDDTRPKVRAEDFLPFFQFPGAPASPGDVILAPAPPVPGQQPPSSATYRQQ